MQPLKITLFGNYYDCQLYRGRLYLWTFDGELRIYNWDQIVDRVVECNGDWLTFKYGYKEGRYLYGNKTKELFEDKEIKRIVFNRYSSSLRRKHILTEQDIEDCMIGQQSSSLPIDTEIYNSILYFSTEKGFYSATAHRPLSEKYKVSTKPQKIWDARVLCITANDYPQMAVSAGSDGLYELRLGKQERVNVLYEVEPQLYRVSEKLSLFSNYVYESIYSSSSCGQSYISMFKLNEIDNRYQRVFERNVEENEYSKEGLRDREMLSWGIRDKVYQATKQKLRVMRFNKWSEYNENERLLELGEMNMESPSRLIRGGAASFGNILEFEDRLVVLQSDNNKMEVPGEITRWRIYPRSINYLNQLHVILNDRIEFYSFNHDSRVDQMKKLNGIEYYVPTSKASQRIYDDTFK